MKKILYLGLFLLFSISLSAQITPNGNSGTSTTAYTNGAPNDPIYIWCAEGLATQSGSLTATSPSGTGPFTFRWYYHNQANSSWSLYTTQTGSSSTISTLPSDGYRVQIYGANNVLIACYNAWVWNMNAQVTASNSPETCDSTDLNGTSQVNGAFTYYNPPPPEAIITPATQITVVFNANHTYASDLAFYLIAPNGTTIALMPNPGVTGHPDGGICNGSDNVYALTFTNTSTNYLNVCSPDVPLTGTWGGWQGGNPLTNIPINWAPLYGLNAAAGGWAVQIYDCIGADVGALTNASITFNNLDATCNASPSITYNSGNINSVINDNSCSAASASIFQVPVSPVLSTPITINANISNVWSSTTVPAANPGALNTSASNIPVGTTDFTLTTTVTYQSTTCTYSKTTSFTRQHMQLTPPDDLVICAAGAEPYSFDLTEVNEQVLNGMNPNEVDVSFYNTEEGAQEQIYDGIPASQYTDFQTDGTEQTIWVRATDYATECFAVTSFVIRADPAPTASSPADIQLCDEDNNGSEVFDLTQLDGDALAGQDPNELTVTYHNTLAGANDNDNFVANATAHPVTDGMTVYIRVTRNSDEDCYSVATVEFIVTPTPVIVPPADGFGCSDTGYTLPAIPVGNYFTAPGGQGTPMFAGDVLYDSQTVYIYAESGTTPNNCIDQDNFNVTIYPLPVVDEPQSLSACESYFLNPLSVGQYHTEPDGGGDVLAPGTEITETTTLYIYAESGSVDTVLCSDEHTFTVTIDNRPELVPATALEVCDDNFDGVGTFNLTSAGNEVIANANGVIVSYHTSDFNAQYNLSPIEQPTAYPSASGTVYIRVINASSTTECYSIAPVELIVHPKPAVVAIAPYIVCDDNNSPDGVEVFDLTTMNDDVTSNPDVTVTYYANQEDAINDENALGNTIESGSTTIWTRLESSFGCFNVTSFQLIVNPLPVVNTNMEPFYACEEEPGEGLFDLTLIEPQVTFGASGYTVAYYNSIDDAQNNPENYLPSSYLSPTTTIYVLVRNVNTGCSIITPANLEVQPAPIAPNQAPLEECDPDNNQVTAFNINPVLAGILADMNNMVTLTVHETLYDAQFGANAIDPEDLGAYTNVEALSSNGVQTLYIVVKSAFTECFDIVPLQLIVHPVPEATEPEPYVLCDNGTNDTDGIAIFDLTTKEAEIMGDIDPTAFSIAFYTTENAAIVNTPIQTPATYPSTSGFVYAKITNNATGCYDIMELELIVNPLPVANDPEPYTLCDVNNPGDEVEEFDLTSKIDEIITAAGQVQSGIITTFYHTYDDAVAGTNSIDNPTTYTNNAAVETIFVKVQFEETGCYRIVLLDVRVEPVPMLVMPTAEETTMCDTTGTGIAVFDLDALVEDMVNNAPGLQVTFHLTMQDAINGVNAIPNTSNYQVVNQEIQNIYIRVVDSESTCTRDPYMITLTVVRAPVAPEDLPDLVLCDDTDNNGQDNQAYFDLTQQDNLIYTALGQDATTLTVHYFTTEANAQQGYPRITNPSHYFGTNGQTIWVRVETTATECFTVTSFDLELNRPLLLDTPTMLTVCNEELPNDHVAQFDLTTKDEEILGIYGVGMGNTVTYYELDPRVTADATPIANPEAYVNPGPPTAPVSNPKTLYVLVTTPEGCKSYTTLTIKVLPLPEPDTDAAPLVLCDDNSFPDGMEVFDLTDAAADIRNNDQYMVLTYYITEQEAHDRTNPISDPTNFNSGSATIWVRAEANTQNSSDPVCYQVVSFELIVNPLPALGENGVIEPYAICEPNTDGLATFDFNTHIDEILGTAVGGDYTVKFFRDATAMAQNTAMPYIYTNTTSPYQQNIIVWVRNDETGCINTAPLTLLVEESAIANPITTTFFECDYDGTNDGSFTFDLTVVEPQVLGSQSPASYSVSYYTSLEDATDGTNAIPTPTAYQNTPDYQMIWVRVTNESTVSKCHDITTLELFVERIPEPVLTTDHTTVCIDFNTGDNVRHATIDSNLPATNTFVWYQDGVVIAGQTGPTLDVFEPGSYTVVATSPTGCISDPIPAMVIERSGPASKITADGYVVGNAFSDNQVITILVEGYGDYEYRLDDGPWQNSNVFQNVSAGSHVVQVRDTATADPCDDLYLILEIGNVSVIDYPNFFTPNGDGFNDTWNIIGLGGADYQAVIYIFDRYGKLIKQLSPDAASEGWDGTYNGAQMPADDYWFTVEYTEGAARKEKKAHFALKR